jgi:long-chain fatty acid transport protein
MRGRITTLAFAASLIASSLACEVHANPLDMYGLGSRSIAMGSGVSADVQDFSANYYNPAGLVRGSAFRMEAGYGYVWHSLYTNGQDNQVDPAHALVAGIVAPTRLFGIPFAFGLAMSVPDDRLARSRLLAEQQPRWELYDNRVQRLYFSTNLAVSPFPWLRIGGGFTYIASTRGVIGLTGRIPYTSSSNAQLFHTVNADVLAVFYPQAGVQIDVHPWLTLGFVYRGEFRFRLDLDADLELQLVLGRLNDPTATSANGQILLQERAVTAFLPQQAVFGASFHPNDRLTIVADLTWVNWSRYVNPTANINVTLNFDHPPGSDMIALPTLPPSMTPDPARFHDTFVPRIGAEYRIPAAHVAVVSLRAGYRYDPSPVPDQTGPNTNFLDCDRHVVATGVGVEFPHTGPTPRSSVSVNVHGDLQLLAQRVVLKSDPADPIGDYAIGGHVFNLGATLATTF